MIRDIFGKHYVGMKKEFRFRGEEPGRLENFSDAVFALAVTLLLISANAPSDFTQLKKFIWELIPFCVCFVLIILVWHEHFIFYFRYGLRNPKIVALNTLFLCIVLFYVYPLKFIWKILLLYPIALLANEQQMLQELSQMFTFSDVVYVMIIYGIGAASVFIVLALMYWQALKNSAALHLNRIEVFDTKASIYTNIMFASVPTLSVVIALVFMAYPFAGMLSGFVYFLYPFITFLYFSRMTKRRKALLAEINNEAIISVSDPAFGDK